MKGFLVGTNPKCECVMLREHFQELKADVVKHMIAQVHDNQLVNGMNTSAKDTIEVHVNIGGVGDAYDGGLDEDKLVFGGMDCVAEVPRTAVAEDEATIKVGCEKELEIYLRTSGLKLKEQGGSFTDPLAWWKMVHVRKRFPILSQLAEVFLSIPATSAPSERMWSRSSGVLTAKRSRLTPEVTSSTMFLKENMEIVRKHYTKAVKGVKDPVPLYLPNVVQSNETKVDVGEDLFGLSF